MSYKRDNAYSNWEQYSEETVANYEQMVSRSRATTIPNDFKIDGWRHYHRGDREWFTYSEDLGIWLGASVVWVGFWNRNGAARGVFLNQTNVPASMNGQLWLAPEGSWMLEHVQAKCHTTTTSVLEVYINGVLIDELDFDGGSSVQWVATSPVTPVLEDRGLACKVKTSAPVDFPGGTVTYVLRRARA